MTAHAIRQPTMAAHAAQTALKPSDTPVLEAFRPAKPHTSAAAAIKTIWIVAVDPSPAGGRAASITCAASRSPATSPSMAAENSDFLAGAARVLVIQNPRTMYATRLTAGSRPVAPLD